jgi:hypothetical protein
MSDNGLKGQIISQGLSENHSEPPNAHCRLHRSWIDTQKLTLNPAQGVTDLLLGKGSPDTSF